MTRLRQITDSNMLCYEGTALPAAIACLLLASCSNNTTVQVPNVVLDTPVGTTPLYVRPPGSGFIPPPPGQVSIVDRDGTYAGIAEPLSTGGGLCITSTRVTGFHVQGNAVSFGGFSGTIDNRGGLQMTFARQWLIGEFVGTTFYGHLDVPANSRFGLGCSFTMKLQRVGT